MTMICNRTVVLRVTSLIVFYCNLTFSQTQSSSALLDQFFLVRRPDYVSDCPVGTTRADAILVFNPSSAQTPIGANYTILTKSGKFVKASILKNIDASGCGVFFENSDVSFGLLRAKQKITWANEEDALVAIKSKKNAPPRLGKIMTSVDSTLKSKCVSMVEPLIPKSERFDVAVTIKIIAPDSNKKFLFLSVNHYDEENQKKAGDKAMGQTGFLFFIGPGLPQLLLKEDNLLNIFTISDLDGDGKYELMVYSGGWGAGTYEMRIFDGKEFNKYKKVLYEWVD